MNRSQHLAWCKERATVYLNQGNWQEAWASFASDMMKHTETSSHPALMLGMMQILGGHITNVPAMRNWIEGFN